MSAELCGGTKDADGPTKLTLLELLLCSEVEDISVLIVADTLESVRSVELCNEKSDADELAKPKLPNVLVCSEVAARNELIVLEALPL